MSDIFGRILALVVCGAGAVSTMLLLPARAQDEARVAGVYCLVGVREVGSCMRLSAGGKFEYFLAYGAYDERSEGSWKLANSEIVVDSLPYDRRPTFSFKRTADDKSGAFVVIVENKAGRPIAGIDVAATCDGATRSAGITQINGARLNCKAAPTAIALGIRMFGLAPQTVDVTGRAGSERVYVFAFDPGDMGKKKFVAHRVQRVADGSLSMVYSDSPIRELGGRRFNYIRKQ